MKKLTLEEIKKRIDDYVASGGSIYDERRVLPYYENLRGIVRRARKSGNKDFDMVDAYKLFGYTFDREYGDYCDLLNILSEHVDANGYVDSIKSIEGKDSPKTLLKKLSTSLNCAPCDYLILMTDFRYKKAVISTNYIEQLRKELKELYPTGDIRNIKRENPAQYNKIRHVCKYSPEVSANDMQSVAEFFGLTNPRFSSTSIYQHLNVKKVINKLTLLFPDKHIDSFAKTHPVNYFEAIRCAASENKTLKQWLEQHGFTYTQAQNTDRLSKTAVDSKAREEQLLSIRSKIAGQAQPEFKTKQDEYYYKKGLAQLVVSELEKQQTM